MSDKELKLILAGQCMAGILANSYEWNLKASDEELARFGWNVATELMVLSKKEEINSTVRELPFGQDHERQKRVRTHSCFTMRRR